MKTIILLTSTAFLWLSPNVVAQDITAVITTKASKFAKENAQYAGNALFCKFDKDKVEDFIAKVQTKIGTVAEDREDQVLSRMDFTNSMIVAATREPKEGCLNFRETFRLALRNVE